MGYVLIGTEASYFSGKARAYLRWKGVDFSEKPATPEVYSSTIVPRVGFPVIPVLLTADNETVQDTADIIDYVERHERGPSVFPAGPVQKLASLLMQLYADEWLVLPAMHYRWTYNTDWILEEFGRTAAPSAPAEERRRLGEIVGERFHSFVPKLGVTDQTISGIEAHYEGFLADFSEHLRNMPFLFGERPSFGDFALFGPLYAHLYRDPKSGAFMREIAPLVASWVERMLAARPGKGELLDGDAVPQTLLPILKRAMVEQLPVLMDTAAKLDAWAAIQSKGTRIPRGLGSHEFTIGGRQGERSVIAFSLYRLQGVLDHYARLKGDARVAADALLDSIGASALKTFTSSRRLERRDFRLVLG